MQCLLTAGPQHPFLLRSCNTQPERHPTPAVDEVPDEGLDVPLRLEKMANQVTYQRLRAALAVGVLLPLERRDW